MQINVAQLLKSPIGEVRHYDIDEGVTCENGEQPVQGKVKFTRTDRGILVNGTLNTEVEVGCSRCLRSFITPLTLNIEEEYFPTTDILSGNPIPIPDEPGAFTIDEHHILDLSEAVCQYSVMGVPMKPLCREGCAGLCPECGQDLNAGKCRCAPREIDSRWAKLAELAESRRPVRKKTR